MSLQVRERNSDDKRWWAPERDVTVLFPNALRASFYVLSGASDKVMHQQLFKDSKHIRRKLELTDDELAIAAKLYAKLVSCVERRMDVSAVLNDMLLWSPRTRAVVGLVFLHLMTDSFCKHYKSTLHKGEDDPNRDLLAEVRDILHVYAEERSRSWWRKAGHWIAQLPVVRLLTGRNSGW